MTEGPGQRPDLFGEAVARLTDWIEAEEEGDAETLDVVARSLESYLRRFGVPEADRGEIASEAMIRFIARVRQRGVEPAGAAGLLTTIARNTAVDSMRRGAREVPFADVEASVGGGASKDDQIVALLDRGADRAAISQAMGRCIAQGDILTARVVRAWLNLADEMGRAPTTREVAALTDVSHSTIARSLKSFRAFVPKQPAETKTGRES